MSNDYWELAFENGDYKHWEFSYPSPELVALVTANLPGKNARVLDVGCGGGNDAIFLAQSGFRVIGIDISAAALRIARKRAKKVHVKVDWVRGSVLELPIYNGTIDFVTDRGLFHLIEDIHRTKFASELFRVLKPNGRVLIRGASNELADRFNPVSKESIDRFFSASKFKRGPVLRIPLFSIEGSMDARIVMLQKKSIQNSSFNT